MLENLIIWIIRLPTITGRTDYHCAEIECGHWRVFAYFAHDDDKGFPV